MELLSVENWNGGLSHLGSCTSNVMVNWGWPSQLVAMSLLLVLVGNMATEESKVSEVGKLC